jgi:hypothetical protein
MLSAPSESGACGVGKSVCATCNGGSICASACPGYTCPAVQPDGGVVGSDASADGGMQGSCPSDHSTSCVDCSGGIFCVAGVCPQPACPGTDAGPDAGADSAPADGGGLACGSITCGSGQLCIQPSCGGGVSSCTPTDDAGSCPAGWSYTATCTIGGIRPGPGCTPPACTSPPGFCIDIPSACGTHPSCTCLPFDVCGSGGGQCGTVYVSGVVMCGSA